MKIMKGFKLLKSELKDSKRVIAVMPIYEDVVGLRIYKADKTECISIMVKISELEKILKIQKRCKK